MNCYVIYIVLYGSECGTISLEIKKTHEYLVLQADAENSIDRTYGQQGNTNENGNSWNFWDALWGKKAWKN